MYRLVPIFNQPLTIRPRTLVPRRSRSTVLYFEPGPERTFALYRAETQRVTVEDVLDLEELDERELVSGRVDNTAGPTQRQLEIRSQPLLRVPVTRAPRRCDPTTR